MSRSGKGPQLWETGRSLFLLGLAYHYVGNEVDEDRREKQEKQKSEVKKRKKCRKSKR